jgi:DNA uptake protein ComE-like DNA-binding protein
VGPAVLGGFFTWLSFLILGVRARRREWIVTATAYGVYSALAFFALARPEVEADETASALMGGGIFVAWIGGAIHAAYAYQSFHRSGLAAATAPAGWPSPSRRNRRRTAAAPVEPAGDDLGLGLGNPAAGYLASSQPTATPAGSAELPPPVEANTASQRTLSGLPGVTPALARRWVDERTRRGGFRDIDDLAVALELQPHEIVRLRPRLSFAAPGKGPKRRLRDRGRGRVLDA